MRAVRVGEAANPGPSDVPAVLDALEFDLSQGDDPPVRQRRRLCVLGTQATVVDSVDLTADDSDQEHPEDVQISESDSDTVSVPGSDSLHIPEVVEEPLRTCRISAAARTSMQFFDSVEVEGEFLTRACCDEGPSGFPQGCL